MWICTALRHDHTSKVLRYGMHSQEISVLPAYHHHHHHHPWISSRRKSWNKTSGPHTLHVPRVCPALRGAYCYVPYKVTFYITSHHRTQNTTCTVRRPLIPWVSLLANSWQFKLLIYRIFYQSVITPEIWQPAQLAWFVKSNSQDKNWPMSETSPEVWCLLASRRKVSHRHPWHHHQWHHHH